MHPFQEELQRLSQAMNQIQRGHNFLGSALRRQEDRDGALMQQLKDLSTVLEHTTQNNKGTSVYGEGIERIESIPGRRVPFDMVLEIPIGDDIDTKLQDSVPISNTGPFVAVARMATFLSEYQFSVVDQETLAVSSFNGRSFGRYRPIHSAWDINDGALDPQGALGALAAPGTGAPFWTSPTTHSPFRTMQTDLRIKQSEGGSSYPRSNRPVPSPFWTTQINSPFPLGALDFYARNEVVDFEVTPSHTNNPEAGNLQAFATPPYPFLGQQFDHHEGIADPQLGSVGADDPDPVTRLPRGTLFVVLHGYRIIQPPGVLGTGHGS